MEQVRILLLLFCPLLAFSQPEIEKELAAFPRKSILSAQLTISPGLMLEGNMKTIYLHGNVEYYFDDHLSVRSDGYYYISSVSSERPLNANHSNFTGLCYHFKKQSQFDPFWGFQPGIAMTQVSSVLRTNILPGEIANGAIRYSPLYSGIIGFNYYSKKYFHILMSVRYVHGRHLSQDSPPYPLDEFRISFGLGWFFKTKKPKPSNPDQLSPQT